MGDLAIQEVWQEANTAAIAVWQGYTLQDLREKRDQGQRRCTGVPASYGGEISHGFKLKRRCQTEPMLSTSWHIDILLRLDNQFNLATIKTHKAEDALSSDNIEGFVVCMSVAAIKVVVRRDGVCWGAAPASHTIDSQQCA